MHNTNILLLVTIYTYRYINFLVIFVIFSICFIRNIMLFLPTDMLVTAVSLIEEAKSHSRSPHRPFLKFDIKHCFFITQI